ncbi:MAG: thiamine phosphate synthase [Phycisphaerales bacterium]|nr:thiamine phosphate synthase [Phycisphaerales bacterium]
MRLPRLYAILDAGTLNGRGVTVVRFAEALRNAGATLVQYRDKQGTEADILANAKRITDIFQGVRATLVMNDSPQLAKLAGWNAVHVGQHDEAVSEARKMLPGGIVGCSTHNEEQVRAAVEAGADYIAIGPVFATGTKANPDPVVGLEGVRRARALIRQPHLPLVAIGGISPANAASVIDAGADSVAVISALLKEEKNLETGIEDFLRVLK